MIKFKGTFDYSLPSLYVFQTCRSCFAFDGYFNHGFWRERNSVFWISLLLQYLISSRQKLLDFRLACIGVTWRHEVLDDVTLTVNEELFEVPGHIGAFEFRVFSEPLVNWVLPLVEHGNLLHNGEFYVILFDEVGDPLGIVRLLRTELVAREGKDLETLTLKVLVHLD